MPAQPPPAPTTWPDAFRAIRRHKGKALVVFAAALLGAIVFLLFAPKAYRSEAKVLVRLGRENATLDRTATLGHDPVVVVPHSREDEINSVLEVLQSRALLEKVVDKVGVDVLLGRETTPDITPVTANGAAGWWKQAGQRAGEHAAVIRQCLSQRINGDELTDRDRAIAVLSRALRIRQARRSNVIDISYEAASPKLAQTVAATLVEQFRDEHLRIHRPQGSRAFFAEQAEKLRGELDRGEDELRRLKAATGLASPEEQRKLLVERLATLEADCMRTEAAEAVAASKVETLRTKLAQLSPTEVSASTSGVGNLGTDQMRNQLYTLEVAERAAAAKYTEEHPRLTEIRAQLADAQRTFRAEESTRTQVTTAPSKLYQETHSAILAEEPHLASLRAEADKLRSQVAEVKQSLTVLGDNEVRIARLTRQIKLNEESYRTYATSLEGARIDEAMEGQRMSNLSIVQSASLDGKPVWPITSLTLALGLLLGMFGGVGAALGAERTNQTFRVPEEIERSLALPVLTSIPRFDREQLAVRSGK